MENSENFDLIEDYLEGLLDAEGVREVETRLAKDAVFAAAFQKHKAAHALLKIGAGIRLKNELLLHDAISENQHSEKIVRFHWSWVIAAGFALLLLIAGFRYGKHRYSDENLVKYYAEAYTTGPLRSLSNADTSQWFLAKEAYDTGDYGRAIRLFGAVDSAAAHFSESQFLLGTAFLLNGEPDHAILPLKGVIESRDIRFSAAAQWYLLLAHIGNHEEEEALALAETLASDKNHAYQKPAARVRRDLSSMFR